MLFYRAALPLSRQTLSYVSRVIRRNRAAIGSCWRKRNPGQQALLVFAHLCKGATLAIGFGVGVAAAWRYVTETVRLLAARAPLGQRRPGRPGGHTASAPQPTKAATITFIVPADHRARPRVNDTPACPWNRALPADHHPSQPPRRPSMPRKRPPLGKLVSAHTTRNQRDRRTPDGSHRGSHRSERLPRGPY